MPGGSCARLDDLPAALEQIVADCRRAVLSTIADDGTVATVPVCFAVTGGRVVTQIDDKPKTSSEPARVRNIRRDPRVTLLFDRWDEDWTRLGWVMVKGRASIELDGAASALTDRYPQYRERPPDGPLIVIEPLRVRWWSWE